MDRTELRQKLVEMLEEETWEKFEDVRDETNLRDGLKVDSVGMVSVLLEIQDRLNIEITSDELENVVEVGDLLDLMEAKLNAQKKNAA